MLDPEELFDLDADRPDLSGAVLLHTLDGFVDAGAAVRLARTSLLTGPAANAPVLARFDVDQLLRLPGAAAGDAFRRRSLECLRRPRNWRCACCTTATARRI